ncbi:MAG: hypothetical protein U1F71_01580 [Verrucomicrobiaceae bacterium]
MTRIQKIAASVPPGTVLPAELTIVCDELDRVGYPISGCMKIRPDDFGGLISWFGDDADMTMKFAAFGAGPDGSILAFWLLNGPDAQAAPVVYLGSEGSPCIVMGRDFREFLQLFAIGYDDLGFDDLAQPPSEPESAEWLRKMVIGQFGLDVPTTGADLVKAAQAATPSLENAIKEWSKRRYGRQ